MIVVDTNVVSEAVAPRPCTKVLDWMGQVPPAELFTTAITEAELLFGVALLPDGRRRRSLEGLIAGVLYEDFAGRILPFDSAAARVFAEIGLARRRAGRPISDPDAWIAAIARSRGASVATRNIADFDGCGVTLIDPWR
ncbi:MAG TPA: type II toxin-antitoxin system VapC family toxin [Stellaceae bacterium]|nr:type II toxin-antitoxin system VapC family toxin [Stellaceae bacterium]